MDNQIEELKTIHKMFRFFLDRKNYTFVTEMMKQFDENSDINELKTILIITKYFMEHDLIRDERIRILFLFDDMIKKNL